MSNNETNRNDVVFNPVESDEVPGYFVIPSHPEYLASPDGRIWYLRAGREVRQRYHATSVGSYLAISTRVGSKFHHALVHLLVAEAFHGPPHGLRVFVNHKDGDKHNNRWGNLEWVTRSENLIHAYKSGLRSDKRSVLMVDHETGEVEEFFSMNAVGRHFGWVKGEIWRTLRDHQDSKYRDRFTFLFPADDYTIRQRTSKEVGGITRVIVAKNYLTEKIVVAPDQGSAEILTGVKRGTINFTLQLAKTPYQLIKGWVFKYLDDPADFPEYSEGLAQASLLAPSVGQPLETTNRVTHTTELHASLAAFAKSLGEHPNTIRRALKQTPGKFKDFDIKEVA